MTNVAVAATVAAGAKCTVTLLEPPGEILTGGTGDVTWNGLGAEKALTVSCAPPVLLTATVRSFVCPTVTVPKSTEVGLTPIAGAPVVAAVAVPLALTWADG